MATKTEDKTKPNAPGAAAEPTAPPPTISLDDALALGDKAISDAIEGGQKTTGDFTGPSWAPTLNPSVNDLREDVLRAKLDKLGKGSSWRLTIAGELVAAFAWGRRVYFLDVHTGNGGAKLRVKLPESSILYGGLNLCPLGSTVAIKCRGKGTAKPGRQAPWLFDVAVIGGGKALAEPRPDALQVESMEDRDRKRRKADRKRAAELADDAADEPRGGGNDVPF